MAVAALGLEADCDDVDSEFVTQNLDLMKTISGEQLSDSGEVGFVHYFRLQSVLESTKNEQLQTDNCQISQIFLFL